MTGIALPVLDACNTKKKPVAGPTPTPTNSGPRSISDIAPAGAAEMGIGDAEAELVVGDQRYAFGLVEPDRTRIVRADAKVFLGTSADLPPIAIADAIPLVDGTEKLGLYVAKLPLTKAGDLLIAVVAHTSDGAIFAGGTRIHVKAKSNSPMPGQPAIAVPTPTVGNPRRANPLCSRKPVCSMHYIGLHEALANGKPTVITFAAPAFCVSEVCGPIVDLVQKQYDQHKTAVNFLHVEAYIQPNSQVTSAMEAWKFDGEPWTYFIDRHGIVKSRISGAAGGEEIKAGVAGILKP